MINNYFFLAIGAFAIFFVALQYVSEALGLLPIKRIAEAISSYFIIGGAIMVFIIERVLCIGIIFIIGFEGIMDQIANIVMLLFMVKPT